MSDYISSTLDGARGRSGSFRRSPDDDEWYDWLDEYSRKPFDEDDEVEDADDDWSEEHDD